MSQFIRKAQPDCLHFFLSSLHDGSSVATEQLVRLLVENGNYDRSTAIETVRYAIRDGLLIPSGDSNKRTANEHKFVHLPVASDITPSTYDCYCFECHLPGALEHCTQCARSFHRLCYRKNPERPNYKVPPTKLVPVFNSDSSDSDQDEEVDYESDVRASSSLQASHLSWTPHRFVDETTVDSPLSTVQQPQTVNTSESIEGKPYVNEMTLASEAKAKVEDVVCVGQVRPPTRKRPATTASSVSYKSEITPNDDDESDLELCTCCRLLKIAALRNPPNLEAVELCHLLVYTYTRNRTWFSTDVNDYMLSIKLSKSEMEIVTQLLFKLPLMTLDVISKKLEQKSYTYLMELLVDMLDFQHEIGVFFGSYSTELESTKYMLRDIAHDLSEIRRCADCFRYSFERPSFWFARPCVQRHELVFAKHRGYPYWPAKVMRVLPNGKYDVRFFGGDNSRALIEVRYIRPIDTDTKALRLEITGKLKKAMAELRNHQHLSTYPRSHFSFQADKEETDQFIRTVLGMNDLTPSDSTVLQKKRGRKPKGAATTMRSAVQNGNAVASTSKQASVATLSDSTILTKKRRKKSSEEPVNRRITRSSITITAPSPEEIKLIEKNLVELQRQREGYKQRNEKLQMQIQKIKESIKMHEYEKKIIKRKLWCYWCLKEAVLLCCFGASYCSKECQTIHWNEGHNKVCKNQNALQSTAKKT